jgi:hypothetical protein
LLFDSGVTGATETRLRVYGDDGSIWVTFNAAWNGSAWARDTPTFYAGGFRCARHEFAFLHDDVLAPTFADFARQWTLRMNGSSNSTFETAGAIREVGYAGIEASNPASAPATIRFGTGVNFRVRFPATPSSITLAGSSVSMTAPPEVFDPKRDGFGLRATQTLPAGQNAYWYGTYTAVA